MLSLFCIFKRLRLVHLDKKLAGLKVWRIFSQLCQLVSIKVLTLLANLTSLGKHAEEERLEEKEEKLVFIDC